MNLIQIGEAVGSWSNANQGVLTIAIFAITITFGWISGIFSALRRKPRFRISSIEGPTFVCTFGTGAKHGIFDIHRTGIALYLHVANVGSASATIEDIEIGYRWAIIPFSRLWWRYGLFRFWLRKQAVVLTDFQVSIGENIKFYPFLTQKSSLSGQSSASFLEIGQSTNGVVYFEQDDSFGGCFPVAYMRQVYLKVAIRDSFGKWHRKRLSVPRVTLAEAQKFNPSFGLTLMTLRNENPPIDLPVDSNGNLLPPGAGGTADPPVGG